MDRLEHDRMFVTVTELGSFAAAAAHLGTSPGQASKMVARLESDLGVRLLNRTTRSVALTEAGRAYFDRIRALLAEFEDLDLAVRNASQSLRGQLRITGPLSFGTSELAGALNAFAALYPEISLDVSFTDRLVNLIDEGIDVAVRAGYLADTSLISRKICDFRVILVGSDAYLGQRGVPLRPEDLAAQECIIDTNFRDPNHWTFQDAEGQSLVVPVRGRLRYSNAEACLNAAELGLGLAYVPGFTAAPAILSGRVRAVLTAFENPPMGVYALYPHNRHLAAKVRALVDFLVERYRTRPHLNPVP